MTTATTLQRKPGIPQRIALREDVSLQSAPQSGAGLTIDRTNPKAPVVRDLKLSGLESRNGRRYLIEAYERALSLYEGAKCNVDHVSDSRPDVPFASRFGIFRNVRLTADGPRGDLYYNPAHPLAETFLWWAQHCPEAVGFSHNALGEGDYDDSGTFVVRAIHSVNSCDLVADPATTHGLRESEASTPMADPADPMLTTEPTPAEPAAEDSYEDHLGRMVQAIMGDKSLDAKAKKAKLLQALKMLDDDGDDDGDEEVKEGEPCKEDEDMDEEKTMESLRVRTDSVSKSALKILESNHSERQRKEKESRVRKAAEEAGLPKSTLTETFVKQLVRSGDDKELKELIEDRRKVLPDKNRKPTSTPPVPAGGSVTATEVDAFVAGMRGA